MEPYLGNIKVQLNKARIVISSELIGNPTHVPDERNVVLTGDRLAEHKLKIFPAMTPTKMLVKDIFFLKWPVFIEWAAYVEYQRFDGFEFVRYNKEYHNNHSISFVPTSHNIKSLARNFPDISVTPEAADIIDDALTDIRSFDEHYQDLMELRKNTDSVGPHTNNGFTGFSEDLPPFKHQRVTVEFCRRFKNTLVLHEQGTGKTYCCIALAKHLIDKQAIANVLIICPKSISKSVWYEQILKFSGMRSVIIEGTKKKRTALLHDQAYFYIIGYELASIMCDELERHVITDQTLIICDEATKIKNPNAKRSRAIHKMGRIADRKIALTGTPCTQTPADVFSIMKFVDGGDTFGTSFPAFATQYFKSSQYSQVAEPRQGAVEAISQLMYKKAIRYEKKEVLQYLPPKIYESRKIVMTAMQQKAYEAMRDLFLVMLEGDEKVEAPVVIAQMMRLSQITGGFLHTDQGNTKMFPDNPKMIATLEMCEEFKESNQSAIIWCRFKNEIKTLSRKLHEIDIDNVTYFGETKQDDKYEYVKRFQERKVGVFIGQPQSGGMGLDLWQANNIIFYSNLYSYADRVQAEDRSHRHGSQLHDAVIYYDLTAVTDEGKQTIDAMILQLLQQKKTVAEMMTLDRRMLMNV